MAKNSNLIPQSKRLAMGEKVGFANGGAVPKRASLPKPPGPALKSGFPDTPQEMVKRRNGIPGMKKGGRC